MKVRFTNFCLQRLCAALFVAPAISSAALTARLTICSEVGFTNQILSADSVDATDWAILTNVLVTANPCVFVDPRGLSQPQRFYRVRVLMPPEMAQVPPGPFTMGAYANEGETNEFPAHTVFVSEFYMDKNDTRLDGWNSAYAWAFTNGYDFGLYSVFGKGSNHPVESVSWNSAVKWCNARSEMEGKRPAYYVPGTTSPYRSGCEDLASTNVNWDAGYRLPTEAEWEKAARSGGRHRFPWADTDTISQSEANYFSTNIYTYDVSPTRGYCPAFYTGSQPYTSPVGSFAANGYGLYDMAGNLWQLCWDWFSADYYTSATNWTDPLGPDSSPIRMRVTRGGSWYSTAYLCRTAYRSGNLPGDTDTNPTTGFRAVLRPPPAPIITSIDLVTATGKILTPGWSLTPGAHPRSVKYQRVRQ